VHSQSTAREQLLYSSLAADLNLNREKERGGGRQREQGGDSRGRGGGDSGGRGKGGGGIRESQ